MQIGVVFPQTEIGPEADGVARYAHAAAELGYRHLLAYDHVVGADPTHYTNWEGPYNIDTPFHEPFVLYGFLAAAEPRLELVTGVIILPQRQTVLVAKQAAEVDLLTRGRFRLGVGIGWNAVEYEALGTDFRNRGRRFEEQIDLLRQLTLQRSVTFAGSFHRVTAAGLNPLPVQRPVPIWIGGSSEPALKRAARLGDGFFPQVPLEGGWKATLDRMREWREAAGKDPATFGIEARINAAVSTADQWRREANEWQALGATHLCVNTMGGGFEGPDAHVSRLREVRKALGELWDA